MKIFLLVLIYLSIIGCNSKIAPPVQLEDEPFTLIHRNLFNKTSNNVPIDVSMSNKHWKYKLRVKKRNGNFLKNTQIMKTFYLVHHADYIKIKGNYRLIKEYKEYFINNGAKAYIELVKELTSSKYVTIILSHKKKYLKEKQ